MKRCNIFTCLVLICALVLSNSFIVPSKAEAVDYAVSQSGNSVLSETMEEICSNTKFSLFVSMTTGEFAVIDKSNENIWYSNPCGREDDPYSGSDRSKTFSQLLLQYVEDNTYVQGFAASYEAEVDGGVTVTKNNNGFTVMYKFFDVKIAVPLKITLTEQGIKASINVKKIREDSDKKLLAISLLPYFGAGSVEDDGYIVVPDGCGALIDFNSGKQNLSSYNEPVYGRDTTLLGETKTKQQENSPLPLFGIKKGDQGFAAIITKGDAVASVVAGVSKNGSGYNNVYTQFGLRSTCVVDISGNKMTVYEQTKPHIDVCEVEYRFLTDDNADYTGIAKTYSKYLLENGVTPITKKSVSLLMEVYGAAKVKRSVLGIPAKVTEPLTTFAQAGNMVDELKLSGVNNITLLYNDYDRDSLSGKIPSKIKAERKLGGNSGLKKLNDRLDDMGTTLVSVVDLNTYQKSIFKNRNSAMNLGGLPGVTYQFNLGTNKPDETVKPYYHLAPALFKKIAKRFVKKYDYEKYGAIGLDSLTENLYSDFSKNRFTGRQQALTAFREGAELLSKNNSIYMRGGSAWALKYTDYIYDMPSDTSHTDLQGRAIPLYQLAVSSIIPYSIEAVNRSIDPDSMVLKCAEYGADIKYDFAYDSLGITGEAALSYLDGTWYKQWSKHTVDSYKRLSEISDIISGEMLRHNKIKENVFVTEYEGGKIVVNYSENDVTVGNTIVKANDFSVLKEGE